MNKNRMWFFDEPDDSGTGGRGAAVFDEPAEKVTTTPEGAGGEGKPEGVVEKPPVTVPSTIDAKEFAKEFGGVIAAELGKAKKDEKAPLTAEEAEKLLNVWKPTKEWIAKFSNLDTQEEAVKELRDGVVKHSDTITQHRLHELQTALETKFNPIVERLQQMDTEQREARFDTTFPQLAKPALKPLLHAVAQNLVNQGKKFDDESSMFTALANGVEAVIKETNPDFKLQPAGSTPVTKTRANNSIPVTSPGSGGGTARRDTNAPTKARGLAIFDKA